MDIKLASIYNKKKITHIKKSKKDNISNAESSMESVEPIFVKDSSIFDNFMMEATGGSD